VESGDRTTDALRGLVQDLDQKLASRAAVPHIDELESLAANRPEGIDGLICDLDAKLATTSVPHVDAPETFRATTRHYTRGLPVWVAAIVVAFLLLGLGTAIVRPWSQGCDFGGDLCRIAALDVDLMSSHIPDSELAATMPQLEILDPDNIFTFGDVFAMESFAHVDFEELLTAADIDRLLGASG